MEDSSQLQQIILNEINQLASTWDDKTVQQGIEIIEQTLGVKLIKTATSFEFERSDNLSFEYTQSPALTDLSVDTSKTNQSVCSLDKIKIDLLSCRSADTPALVSAKGHFRGESFGVTAAKIDPIKLVSKWYLAQLYKRAVIKLNPLDRLNEILTENEMLQEKIQKIEQIQDADMQKVQKKATQLIKENEDLQLKLQIYDIQQNHLDELIATNKHLKEEFVEYQQEHQGKISLLESKIVALTQDNTKLLDAVNYVKGEYKATVAANDKLKALYLEESSMWDKNRKDMVNKMQMLKAENKKFKRGTRRPSWKENQLGSNIPQHKGSPSKDNETIQEIMTQMQDIKQHESWNIHSSIDSPNLSEIINVPYPILNHKHYNPFQFSPGKRQLLPAGSGKNTRTNKSHSPIARRTSPSAMKSLVEDKIRQRVVKSAMRKRKDP